MKQSEVVKTHSSKVFQSLTKIKISVPLLRFWSVICSAAAPEQIVISDDEEAAVRLVQLEEDEVLARSLQVRSSTRGVAHKLTWADCGNVRDALCSFRPSSTKRRHTADTSTIIIIIIIFFFISSSSSSRAIRGWDTLFYQWTKSTGNPAETYCESDGCDLCCCSITRSWRTAGCLSCWLPSLLWSD